MHIPSCGNNTYCQSGMYPKASENAYVEKNANLNTSEGVATIEQQAVMLEDTTSIDSEIKKVNTHLSQMLLSAWFQKKLEEAKIHFQYEEGEITVSERNNLQNGLGQDDITKKDAFRNNAQVIDLGKFLDNAEAFMTNKATANKQVNLKG